MNIYQLTQKIIAYYNNQVNIITKTSKGFTVSNITGKMEKNDVKKNEWVFYSNLEDAKKSSICNNSFKTIVVEHFGTDCKKSKITRI